MRKTALMWELSGLSDVQEIPNATTCGVSNKLISDAVVLLHPGSRQLVASAAFMDTLRISLNDALAFFSLVALCGRTGRDHRCVQGAGQHSKRSAR